MPVKEGLISCVSLLLFLSTFSLRLLFSLPFSIISSSAPLFCFPLSIVNPVFWMPHCRSRPHHICSSYTAIVTQAVSCLRRIVWMLQSFSHDAIDDADVHFVHAFSFFSSSVQQRSCSWNSCCQLNDMPNFIWLKSYDRHNSYLITHFLWMCHICRLRQNNFLQPENFNIWNFQTCVCLTCVHASFWHILWFRS